MGLLVLGLILFFATHSISMISEDWRHRQVARLGEWRWKGLYSLVALVGLWLIIWGYGLARYDPVVLYSSSVGLRHLALLLLIPVFPLLLAAYLPGRIQSLIHHPMLIATQLWAIAHLLANGTLADVLLFGTFLIWAVANHFSLKRRTPLFVPCAPLSPWNDYIAVIGGLALYVAFILWLHIGLIGVSPIGR